MVRGGRTNLATLVGSTGVSSTVDGDQTPVAETPAGQGLEIALADLAENPRNPREVVDVDDLESIKEMQLQPALGVSRSAYLKLWPEDEPGLEAAKVVVVMGNRRLRACATYGRPTLDVVVKDEVASSRATFRAAALRENVERENLDVIEEAKAVDRLIDDAGSAMKAAEELGKTAAWVSQRRALLKLTPELQQKLRAGELAIRVARNLAQVPMEQQVARWQTQLAKQHSPVDDSTKHEPKTSSPVGISQIAKAFKRWDAKPGTLASALVAHLDNSEMNELISQLRQLSDNKT